MTLLPELLTFAVTLAALVALSRWIGQQVQLLSLRLTGSSSVAVLAYYLLMFPGILLHETSHFLMARLLGLKVGKFELGPRRRKNHIELGAVTIASGGPMLDSLVGLAPFIAGTSVLLLVTNVVFDVGALGQAWSVLGVPGVLRQLDGIWQVTDFWVWAYVIFVVSNAMMPSPSDRQPWRVAGIYLGIALVVFALLGGLQRLDAGRETARGILQILCLGFVFTLALNAIVAAVMWVAEALLIRVQRPRRR